MLCPNRHRAMQRAHWYLPLTPLGGVNLLELFCNGSLSLCFFQNLIGKIKCRGLGIKINQF